MIPPTGNIANAFSLFIHIMPPVTLHCLVHLTKPEVQKDRFPAIYAIRHSHPSSPEHYSLWAMMFWATIPYLIWQLSYHLMITVRRREKIAAGRPTSFTWLRRSYSKSWIGKLVLALPDNLQETAFMLVQYIYALGTMVPCPLWFWYPWLSSAFLTIVFVWSIYNGATFYIDIFGKRFQTELEQLKKDVAKWQATPEMAISPEILPKAKDDLLTPRPSTPGLLTPALLSPGPLSPGSGAEDNEQKWKRGAEENEWKWRQGAEENEQKWRRSIDGIPMLDAKTEASSSAVEVPTAG